MKGIRLCCGNGGILMDKLIIDPEFRDKIPPLTEDEFSLLEENILSDGAVFSPLIVMGGPIR